MMALVVLFIFFAALYLTYKAIPFLSQDWRIHSTVEEEFERYPHSGKKAVVKVFLVPHFVLANSYEGRQRRVQVSEVDFNGDDFEQEIKQARSAAKDKLKKLQAATKPFSRLPFRD